MKKERTLGGASNRIDRIVDASTSLRLKSDERLEQLSLFLALVYIARRCRTQRLLRVDHDGRFPTFHRYCRPGSLSLR